MPIRRAISAAIIGVVAVSGAVACSDEDDDGAGTDEEVEQIDEELEDAGDEAEEELEEIEDEVNDEGNRESPQY